jgi:hypothetical protein
MKRKKDKEGAGEWQIYSLGHRWSHRNSKEMRIPEYCKQSDNSFTN